MKNILFTGLLLLLLTSCEEEISVHLKNAEPALVIEGTVSTLQGQTVTISSTTDYYDPSVPEMKSGASVNVYDDTGNKWIFNETQKGIYRNEHLVGEVGRSYRLEVEIDGQVITGESYMKPVIPIDSLRAEYFPGSEFVDPGYFLVIQFTDPPGGDPNYYRVKMFKGEQPNPAIQLIDDRFTDGTQIEYFLYGGSYQPGDTAIVELQSLDYATYIYFYTLSNVLSGQQQGATSTPANPNTNLDNNALGYFGAIAIYRDTLIIQ